MAILTLTTDWGLRDHYLAAFKGELICAYPEVRIVDISHEIEHHNILQASFVLKSAFQKFPSGTIHYIGLSAAASGVNSEIATLAVSCRGHFFIGQDSGIFSLLLDEEEKEIVKLNLDEPRNQSAPVHSLVEAITNLLKGVSFHELGDSYSALSQSYLAQPTVDSDSIRGTILYIDSFGNAIVNVTRELFEKERKERDFTIFLRKSTYNIQRLSKNYNAEEGEMVAFFNNENYLEIALNRASASKLLGLKVMDPIRIEFQ